LIKDQQNAPNVGAAGDERDHAHLATARGHEAFRAFMLAKPRGTQLAQDDTGSTRRVNWSNSLKKSAFVFSGQ
jgi:hypothetical protein